MSLSEQEQRILDDLENALYIEDPNLDYVLSSAFAVHRPRRLVLTASAAIGGLGLVLFSLASDLVAFGVLGFVLLVVGINGGVEAVAARRAARRSKPR
jgi:uncharacterized membrane protein HdeD (DUF308 family)